MGFVVYSRSELMGYRYRWWVLNLMLSHISQSQLGSDFMECRDWGCLCHNVVYLDANCIWSKFQDVSFMVRLISLCASNVHVHRAFKFRPVREYLLIRDTTLVPNALWFEYTNARQETRTRTRKIKSNWLTVILQGKNTCLFLFRNSHYWRFFLTTFIVHKVPN